MSDQSASEFKILCVLDFPTSSVLCVDDLTTTCKLCLYLADSVLC